MLADELIGTHLCRMSTGTQHPSALIPLAWPEMTARGREKIWHYLRQMGIVKNVNMMVGHAGMVIVEADRFHYYDFGRYITPRIMGRPRSAETDPKLRLDTVPTWDEHGRLTNFEALLAELESKKAATHGEGRMFASVFYGGDSVKALTYARALQEKGYVGYHGLDKKQTNCARFVTNTMLASMGRNTKEYRRFKYPVTYAPSPYFNVLAGASSGQFVIYSNGQAEWQSKPMGHALRDILVKGSYAFRKSKALHLPPDTRVGQLEEPDQRPAGVLPTDVYLGGIGEGAYHRVEAKSADVLEMARIDLSGNVEFTATYACPAKWVEDWQAGEALVVHDTHYAWMTLAQKATNERQRCRRIP